MLVLLSEAIRYDSSVGTTEIACPGCRESVVADVHEKLKGVGRVGRCRLCGFLAVLPVALPLTNSAEEQYLATNSQVSDVAEFITLSGSPYELACAGGEFTFTKERALLAAIAVSLAWHRPRVLWSRTIFVIIAAFVLGLILVAIAVVSGMPGLAYFVMAALFIGVFLFHHRLVRLRTLADVSKRVTRFRKHFGVSVESLVKVGLNDGGDFQSAAQFLKKCTFIL